MARLETSNIPDRGEDVRYAQGCVGADAAPTGRLRVVAETSRIEVEWEGSLGRVWLPIPLVSQRDARVVGAQEAPVDLGGQRRQ